MTIWSTSTSLSLMYPMDLQVTKIYLPVLMNYATPNWTRVFKIDDVMVYTETVQRNPMEKELDLKIEAEEPLTPDELNFIIQRIRFELGSDEDFSFLRDIRRKDVNLDIAIRNNPGFRLYANSDPIEAAYILMFKQKQDYPTFYSKYTQFLSDVGTKLPWYDNTYTFPTIHELAELEHEDFEPYQLGKIGEYLANLTKRQIESFEFYSYYPIFERGLQNLSKIKGIGDHTARLLMIYAARRYEKAFLDTNVQNVLDQQYKVHRALNLTEFDHWVEKTWPENPAVILHALLQNTIVPKSRAQDQSTYIL